MVPSVQRLQSLKPEPICQGRRKHSLGPANQGKNGGLSPTKWVSRQTVLSLFPAIPPLHLLLPAPNPVFLPTAARVAFPTCPSDVSHMKSSVLPHHVSNLGTKAE